MRSGTALQSLAALAACLLVICLTLGLSAVFLHAALKGSQSTSTSSPHQLKDAGTGEDRTSGGAGRTRGETVQPAGAAIPPQHRKETTPPTDTSGSVEQELVRPVKVWPRADRSSPGEAWQPTPQELLHLDTGHYRAMKAEVWDPHPRYEFKGFGRTFRLDLRRDRPVSSRPIKVLHVWRNSTRREETGPDPRSCMYTGQVLGDPASRVSLSLCHGMRGHIWTSEGSFTIEPAEAWRGPTDNMLHTFSRLPAIRHSCHIDDDVLQTSDMQEEEEEMEGDHVDWTTENNHLHRRRKRSYPSEGYTIELMVAVDHKMEEFHGADLNHYIINLITAVDKIFKDPSIGNPMSVALVNILVLKMTQDWTKNASYMLNRFCEYQHSMNVHNDSHPEHHDVAIFLTREKVCREPERNRCDSIGLAEVGGICRDDNKQSCAIVKDMGLTTVFTIAHELGHVLSLPHDSSSNGSKCHRWMKQWDKPYLMASVLSRETRPWVWSNCSRHLLTAFLEEGHGWCLQDSPLENLAPTDNFRPLLGETFNLDKQCEFAYGKGYTLCPRLNTCVELWCQNSSSESDTCSTSHVPWADGTPCGHGKWCQKRQCVSKETLKPVHGGWSKWQRYGDCSRTCGGGVRMSVRECNNPTPANGGKYCLGERVRHHSCNIFECPPGSEDFREQQCAKFNNRNFNLPGLSPRVRWVPKYDGISPEERCKLYCRNYEDKNQYFELKEKVIDGTVCGPNTFDICVNGICLPAGCDHALYSDKQLDHCGQCGGNNSTCKVISGAYNITQYNYRSVITIPAGASNLEVRQHGYLNSNKDNSHLALFDNETGQYFLNGNFQVSGRKLILYGGTTIEYTGSEEVVEMIRASRPLTKDLNIQVFSFATLYPPDITYEFTVPKHSLFQYSWGLSDEWTPCDKVCNGRRTQIYKCLRGWQEFSPELCSDSEKGEPIARQCNTDCSLEWRAVGWSDCSSDCGAGYREIKYECVVWEKNGAASSPTEEWNCESLPRPPDSEPCEGLCVEPNWIFSPWGECSKSCGGGVRRRKAYCMDSYKQKRNDSECPSNERKTEEACNNQECPTWKVGEWTACSVTCGGGQRHRAFWCEYNGKRDSYEKCPLPQPSITDPCNDEPCAYWIEEDWSECSVTCGKGEETRHVYCSQPNACSNNSKPMTIRSCYMPECSLGHANAIPGDVTSRFTWRQKWSECSVSCGKGETRSTVECHDNIVDKVTDFRNCAGQYPPPHGKVDICYMSPCPRWVLGDWEPCSAICGPGSQSRRITCESHSGLALPESACPPDSKPAHEEKRCHIVCPQRNEWIKLPWSQCSVSCGTGIMVRKVVCHGHCRGPKPPMSMACDAGPCAEEGTWNVGAWSQCSASCGEGSQERQVRCQSRETGETLPESYCSPARRPARTQLCQSGSPCQPVFKWEVTRWTPCSSSCGRGVKRRHVECKSSRGETVRDEFCLPDGPRRPRDTKPCKKSPCPFDWHEGDWSQCSSSCGPGVQQRKVRCVKNYFNGRVRKEPYEVNERFCNPKTRPEHKKDCEGNCNNKFKWETGAWHPCDKPCSRKGKQKRSLYCYYGEKTVPLRFCPKDLRPKRRRKCENIQCPSCRAVQEGFNKRRDGEYQLWLRGRNVTIFCYNMQGSNPTEYISLPNDNYAEIFSPSNRHTRRCSGRGGMSSDVCETDWLQAPYGFTFFKKIHINVSSLIIDTTDWTFATTMKGSPVSYGEAGDCHTRGLCPVGKFTINLQSTGFRVSPATTWVGLGQQHAPPHIEVIQDGQKVVGQCGGCCGFCKPRNGLKLDLLPP